MSDKTIQTINPLTEEVLQTYPIMTDAEANDVVCKSHEAHLEWRLKSLEERAKIIGAIGEQLRKDKDAFAQLMTDEVGKLLGGSKQDVGFHWTHDLQEFSDDRALSLSNCQSGK